MSEPFSILFLLLSTGLWMAGGTWHKAYRRLLLPLLVFSVLYYGADGFLKNSLLCAVGVSLVNSLGYGDRTPWWGRLLVFASYALPSLFLSTTLWWFRMLLSAGFLSSWFILSRLQNRLFHKSWESLAGLVQATTIIMGANG